ncbi:MAG: UDP-N-acetylglucosamine 2-epimerase (hydrolyzing) [Muribaculaceae bacterium]|nr:UDP-N-acetylglucosamine 2-epimerase (hydrolyzing) [Muribaculaceae bacterium]
MIAMNQPRKICIVTGTRAEWGLLSPIARQLSARPDVRLQIVATNMHLDPRYGMTVNEIVADGFTVDERVPIQPLGDSEADRARAMSLCGLGMVDAFERLEPDMIVILGDRYEMLAVASVATVMRIPVVHIAGGEITRGAIDDAIRHAITKMAALHLTSTDEYRNRVISMGENPSRVITTGAIGVYNAMNEPLMTLAELEASLGFELGDNTLLVTMHPTTMDPTDTRVHIEQLLKALDTAARDCRILFTYPNNDARGAIIIDMINDYAGRHPSRVHVVPSLGKVRYLSALRYVLAVVGNSSSGIVEVPSMKIPTVDIGNRQAGRLAADSVIHCGTDSNEISRALALALSERWQEKAKATVNPYYRNDTLSRIVNAITSTSLESLRNKQFYDQP